MAATTIRHSTADTVPKSPKPKSHNPQILDQQVWWIRVFSVGDFGTVSAVECRMVAAVIFSDKFT